MSLFNYVSGLNKDKYVAAGKPKFRGWVNALADFINQKFTDETTLVVDTISEATSATGVTIDGVLIKDNALTSAIGVTIDGVLIKDNALTAKYEAISEASATTLTAADSGKTFFINGDTAASAYVLPAPVAGLNFKWVWTADCDNAITITTADTTDTTGDMFVGGVLVCAAADLNTFVEVAADNNRMTFDDNVANSAGGAGQWIEVICTEDAAWFVRGVVNMTSDADGTGTSIFSDVD